MSGKDIGTELTDDTLPTNRVNRLGRPSFELKSALKSWSCSKCAQTFGSKRVLKQHLSEVHSY
jgi:hypothetical protein